MGGRACVARAAEEATGEQRGPGAHRSLRYDTELGEFDSDKGAMIQW
jgi:hypothetical protein